MLQREFLNNIEENRGIIYKIINLYADEEEDKKDLYQEIVYQAWKSFENFKGEAKFSTWLYKIGLNVSLTYLKKRDKRSEIQSNVSADTVMEHKELSERAEILHRAIRTLSEIDRGLILLHLEGYDNSEISEIAGISRTNTGVKLHRIKQNLIEILNKRI